MNPRPESLELVGGDLAVVHEVGHRPERAVRGQLVELLLRDDAVSEEPLHCARFAFACSLAALRASWRASRRIARSALTASRIAVFWVVLIVPLVTSSSSTSDSTVSVFGGFAVVPDEGVGVGAAPEASPPELPRRRTSP